MFSWKNQKLEVYILLVFLFLIAASSAIIITFTYERDYRSLLNFSRGTINRASSLIVEKVDCLLHEIETPPMIFEGLIKRNPKIGYENQVLVGHMLDIVKYHASLYGFHAADSNGNYLSAIDLSLAGKPDHAKAIPQNTAYLVVAIEAQNGGEKQTWYYYDAKERFISSEKIQNSSFDPRESPWYQGAIEAKEPYWTHIYKFSLTDKMGIDVSIPVYNIANELLAVIGTNLTLDSFSNFLVRQKIGKTGRAFILDAKGKLILPVKKVEHEDVVASAYQQYKSEGKSNLIVKYNKEKYLVSVRKFSTNFGEDWQLLIVVPFSDYFGEITQTHHQTMFISLAILIIAGMFTVFFSKRTSKPIVQLAEEVNKIQQFDFDSNVQIESHIKEIILLNSSIASMRSALRSFTKYVPRKIVKTLLEKGKEIELSSEKREITLFFSDITGFTALSETTSLDQLNDLLAKYFDGMTHAILNQHGTIDKYIGDGLMAFWNAPDDMSDHAIKGCLAALECLNFLNHFNEKQRKSGGPELITRIGMNTGEMIVGNIGTDRRMNYTVLGDVVNTTQRIQEKNKEFYTRIIISEETVKRTQEQFLVRPLDVSELKGKKGKIQLFELIAQKDQASEEQKIFVDLFTKAYHAYSSENYNEAKKLFQDFLKKYPEDEATKIYLERLKNL